MDEECIKKKRRLYVWEIEEFSPIFGNSLNYYAVWIHECTSWPDLADRIGRRLKRMPPPGERDHNAITLGNHCYFPVTLPGNAAAHRRSRKLQAGLACARADTYLAIPETGLEVPLACYACSV